MDKAIEAIEGIINFIFLKNTSEYFKEFCFYTKKLDTVRSETLETACPELSKLLQKYS